MSAGVDAGHFSLRWKNFHRNLQMGFEDLLENKELLDVTLACDGQSLQAHKNILAVCSPYFRNLFKGNPCKHPIIFMQNVRISDLKAILQFMYQGETDVREEDLPLFLKTAEALHVRGLVGVHDIPVESEDGSNTQTLCPDLTPLPLKRRRTCSPVGEEIPIIKQESEEDPLSNYKEEPDGESLNEEDEALASNCVSVQLETAGPSIVQNINPNQEKKKEGEGFLCTICNKFYTSRYNLKAHEKNIHGKILRPATCDICQKVFKNEDALRTHTYYKHTGPDALSGQTHQCGTCGKVYKLKHDLISHTKNAHGELARPYECELCLKVCKNWHAFRTHKSRNHKNELQNQGPQSNQ